jgi:hypothetical protein
MNLATYIESARGLMESCGLHDPSESGPPVGDQLVSPFDLRPFAETIHLEGLNLQSDSPRICQSRDPPAPDCFGVIRSKEMKWDEFP